MEDFVEIGHTKKTFGVHGALKWECPAPYREVADRLRAVFFELQGGPVPFFVTEIRGGANPTIRFEEIETPEAAKPLAGRPVYAAREELQALLGSEPPAPAELPEELIGLVIEDRTLGVIGPITELLDLPEQLLAVVRFEGEDRYIPLHEDLILAFAPETNRLVMDLPDGLLTM